MKSSVKLLNFKMLMTLLVFNLIQAVLWAQDNGGTTTTSTKKVDVSVENSSDWYTSPWVWVIGAAVFILLLVALLGGGSRGRTTDSSSDRVTVTKTVERDTNV